MVVQDVAGVVISPRRALPVVAEGRSLGRASAVVLAAGVAALGLSVAAAMSEPASVVGSSRAAEVGVSAALPVLFLLYWVAGGWLVDVGARLLGGTGRLRAWLVVSAHTIPVLVVFEAVRLAQAGLDHVGGATGASTAVGFLEFGVLLWFIGVTAVGVAAVYRLPALHSVTAALLPYAVMATLLAVLLVVASLLHGIGLI